MDQSIISLSKNILNDLTIVVPTYNRQKIVIRLIDYWSGKGPHVIILDGSTKPLEKELISKYATNIRYIHQPGSIYLRMYNALHLIKSNYVVLGGDDEFYIPSALESCLMKLNEENELVACCGRSVGFKVDNKNIFGLPQYESFADFNLDSKYPEERITRHMSRYVPRLTYAICKRDIWVKVWESILAKEFAFYAAGEIQFEMSMSIAGRSLILPELMWLRSYGESEQIQSSEPSLNSNIRIDSWLFDESNKLEKVEFIKIMSQVFKEVGYKGDCEKILTQSIKVYINNNLSRKSSIGIEHLIPALLVNFRSLLFKLVRFFCREKNNLTLRERANMLIERGVMVNFQSLAEIEKIISKYHGF